MQELSAPPIDREHYIVSFSVSLPLLQIKKIDHHRGPVTGASVSNASDVLVTSSHDSTVRLWSLDNFSLLNTIELPSAILNIQISNDSVSIPFIYSLRSRWTTSPNRVSRTQDGDIINIDDMRGRMTPLTHLAPGTNVTSAPYRSATRFGLRSVSPSHISRCNLRFAIASHHGSESKIHEANLRYYNVPVSNNVRPFLSV